MLDPGLDRDKSFDVAVTGWAARLPGPHSLDEWWRALTEGAVLTTRYTRTELLDAGLTPHEADDPDYVPVGGRLNDADRFDASFFGIGPREAELMDPQHRLMLEVAYNALEDAGPAPPNGAPITGVYASGSGSGYLRAMLANGPLDAATLDQALHGAEPDFIASLIAYKLGLTGPAIGVQTACSSSLVGVHLAVQALISGDCDQAVVVAAGIGFPMAGHLHFPGGIKSPTGRCRPFDAQADGVVEGAGAAAIVLRRLEDVAPGEPRPYGLVLGSAVNNDGRAKAGYYAPSVSGQEAVIRAALRAARAPATSIGYLETHGTGTRVGDPIEWAAASRAYAGLGACPGQMPVGALKANIGHLDAAAGLAALIKALHVLETGLVPPVAGFEALNPLLLAEDTPLRAPQALEAWRGPEPRRAGVSAFGIGGTNAHVILERAPDCSSLSSSSELRRDQPVVLGLRAHDPEALVRMADQLADQLERARPALPDVVATLARRGRGLRHRLAVSGRNAGELARALREPSARFEAPAAPASSRRLVLLFPGQGAQRPGMAQDLAASLPGFRASLEACLASGPVGVCDRVRQALLDPGFSRDELDETALAQPAIFAMEHAAATALQALGARPIAVAGHSLGQVTAACVAGLLPLPLAWTFVLARGAAMQACPPGAMLAVACGEAEALTLTAGGAELVAVNAEESCVLGGPEAVIGELEERLGDRARRLRTRRAFHSTLIEPALAGIATALVGWRSPTLQIALCANSDGHLLRQGEQVNPSFFLDETRRTVRFDRVLGSVREAFPDASAVEVGPGTALSAWARQRGIPTTSLAPSGGAVADALAAVWAQGVDLDLTTLCPGGTPARLPPYPFRGPRWIAAEARSGAMPPIEVTPPPPPPTSPSNTEAALAGLWEEVLRCGSVTAQSDFFDLGGDSLMMTALLRRVNQRFDLRAPARAMLTARTLGEQAAILEAARGGLQPKLADTHR